MSAVPSPLYTCLQNTQTAQRLTTYTNVVTTHEAAIQLYEWNSRISGQLWPSIQAFEVTIRNALDEALEVKYGVDWPTDTGLHRSLETKNLRKLQSAIDKLTRPHWRAPAGTPRIPLCRHSLISELTLGFWQGFFTQRFERHLLSSTLPSIFPNMDHTTSVTTRRLHLHGLVEDIRELRNRIAHHEPIFDRSITLVHRSLLTLVDYRCQQTRSWIQVSFPITALISQKPPHT